MTIAPPMLIALPHGLGVSGVSAWALRLADELSRTGHPCGLVVHPETAGTPVLASALGPRVRITRLRNVPPIDATGGDVSAFLPGYRQALGELCAAADGPVVVSPNLHGDCYGIVAALANDNPAAIRVVGWQHSDIAYDTRVLAHYAPLIGRFVAVSARTEGRLHEALGGRSGDVRVIAYGVAAPDRCPPREPLRDHRGRPRPLRLVYSGRIEHPQKRILALAALSAELTRRAVPHDLTIAGDGPASADLDAAIAGNRSVRRVGALPPGAVTALLDAADALVLPSRYEGLSVAMLEAMSRGCVPIVTRVESGIADALRHAGNGFIADAGPEDTEEVAGRALADAVERFAASDPAVPARAAWQTIRRRFSLGRHVTDVRRLLVEAAGLPPRAWPEGRPFAFTAPGSGGSVPPEGAERMQRVLRTLAGRRVAIHGTGEHTRQLRGVILASPATLVAFADDDPGARGRTMWGLPVIAPAECAAAGATDVVISTWMHQDAVWARRAVYGALAVHRLYAA